MPAIMVTIGSFTPGGLEHYERYAAGVLPLLEKAGVKLRERLRGIEPLVGEDFPELLAVMEFPSYTAMKSFLASAEYRAMVPHRERAFRSIQTFCCDERE